MHTQSTVYAVLVGLILVLGSVSAVCAAETPAAEEIAAWARLPADGPQGRPLPLTGSWNTEDWGAPYAVEMIQQGHHILPTFVDPNFIAAGAYLKGWRGAKEKVKDRMENYYRPALQYCRDHNLPIVFRGWNWGDRVGMYEDAIAGEERPAEESARVIQDGKTTRPMDPFGPIERWREWGEFWFGNELVREFQRIYPDPPMVIWLNNNEGPKVRSPGQIPDDYPRMVAIHGRNIQDNMDKARAIREGYQKRYAALFEAARQALIESSWEQNVRFVAYNNLWGTGYIGSGNRPRPGIWFEREEGWLAWRMYDGGMPELYDNDWQPGKTDHRPHSPQTEAMNYFSVQSRIFQRDPDFYWSTICWDGGAANHVFRGRRASSKPFHYITRGQRWDFDRYEGWIQFTLWTTRPRTYREFRGGADRDAYYGGAWRAVLRSVDRPWNHPTLREFWRFGNLVPNRDETHPFELSEDQPGWIRGLDRWYLLSCDANPPRAAWEGHTKLRIFALALVLGDAPERRWLIYAHAPLGAVPDVTVAVPGYGEVTLESVPKTGSFFRLEEGKENVETLIAGGPDELTVRSDKRRTRPGTTVRLEPGIAHAPDRNFTAFAWDFGDGRTLDQNQLGSTEHRFDEPGHYLVTVEGRCEDGSGLIAQTAVFVGDQTDDRMIYDLPLDAALRWEGPWDSAGENGEELITYRHLPNAGRLPAPILVGGKFVDDPERGKVLELSGEHQDGIWLIRHRDTVMAHDGHPNRTVSLWFKPEDVKGRQILYEEGHHLVGFNIYLDGDTLYAGSWAPVDGQVFGSNPVRGRNWDGHWLTQEGIEPGHWYHVALVLRDATSEVEDDKQHLYVNGKHIAGGPGTRIPRSYGAPRIGRAATHSWRPGMHIRRCHDGKAEANHFRGRLDHFRFTHSGEIKDVK